VPNSLQECAPRSLGIATKAIRESEPRSLPISTANIYGSETLADGQEPPRRPIHVLAIIEGDKLSGPAKNVLEFCRTLGAMSSGPSIKLSLVMFERLAKNLKSLPRQESELAEAARLSGVSSFTIAERFAFDLQALSGLKSLIAKLQPDLIETHAVKSHFLVRLSGAGKKKPWVAFHHGYTQTDLRSPLYNQLDRWSLRAPAHIVTVSLASKEQLAARAIRSSNITVLHNAARPLGVSGVEMSSAKSERRERLGLSPQDRVILCVGRLSHEKAPADLVTALLYLEGLKPKLPVQLVFVGDGPERGAIERIARSIGVFDRVKLAGYCRDVRPYYEAADLVAIPSISEASPNALLEAMAAGVPVAATSAGGIPEIVSHEETALLVKPGDPAAMANAIHRLLSSEELRTALAGRARKLIQTKFSPESRTKVLADLYMRLVAHPSSDSGALSAAKQNASRPSNVSGDPAGSNEGFLAC
jgi:glycosyltransferase involved in cell wall biosynthesis